MLYSATILNRFTIFADNDFDLLTPWPWLWVKVTQIYSTGPWIMFTEFHKELIGSFW